ncbi:MAG: amidase, partial [Patescibacteria group bacterium]
MSIMTDLKNLTKLTIKEAQKGLQKKDFSAQELTQGCLQRIDEKEDDLNAFITVTPVKAIEQAKAVDELLDKDVDLPPLAGIPLAIKDNICIEDVRTTAGSQILENFVSPYDATVISKLRKQKAVFLGKTNMDEFAMGSSTEHSAFGPTKNPHDKRKVPGGSSGGSAVAVESGMCLGALGSDTGGSIRQPASFCGVVGLKPTYGAVSRYGLIALTSSLDQIGPLTKTVEDSVLLYNALVGKDERDATTIDSKEVDLQEIGFSDLKIGYSPDQLKQLDKEMRSAYQQILEHCEGHGAEIVKVNLPNEKYATAVYYLVTPSEASANLARYDGIRYGTRISGDTFRETFIKSRSEGLGEEVKRRIMLG